MTLWNTRYRYGSISIGLHGLTLLVRIGVYACINLTDLHPKGSESRDALKTWHFMLGLAALFHHDVTRDNAHKVRTLVLATLMGAMSSVATAQPGEGMGPGDGRGKARWGSDVTHGWALMSQRERNEHRDRMRSMKTYEECKSYQDQHHEQMAARAKERGGKALAQPRRDACGSLQK